VPKVVIKIPAVERWMNQFAVDGRKTAVSNRPSPSDGSYKLKPAFAQTSAALILMVGDLIRVYCPFRRVYFLFAELYMLFYR